jgi:hypothetical protein
MDKKI